jgi:cell division protein FtsQ
VAREGKKSGGWAPWGSRRNLWLGLTLALLLFVSTSMAALKIRQYVIHDPEFILSRERTDSLTIEGLRYTSRAKVRRVFSLDFDHSIFSIPLDERRRRLMGIDWVEDASISRIWPDRLLVRLRERAPVAYVSFKSGVVLIDAYGALLDPPPASHFAFPLLSGVREAETEDQRRERVRALLRLEQEMGYLFKDISEVDVSDVDDIRVVTQVDRRAVQLLLGDANYASRYRNFTNHYPEIHRHSPEVKTFDLRLDDRITARK